MTQRWHFWIDRGGTFTDIVARHPNGHLVTHKLLSDHPERYEDAVLVGIRHLLKSSADQPIPVEHIATVHMGTTVATNALLERRGERVLLLITQGFGDALQIADQQRPQLFARHIVVPPPLYERVIEVEERVNSEGQVVTPLNLAKTQQDLADAYRDGFRAVAIVLLHSYRYPDHEQQIAQLAHAMGYPQVSVSHVVSPLIKLIGRGDTTVVDAYLSPILRRYVGHLAAQLPGVLLFFMQSTGGLAQAAHFQGKDSLLSGPAGGLVGAVATARLAGFERVVTFDMGGTSTDVAHWSGAYERTTETRVSGVRIRVPMLDIHTVAAGGGSVCWFDGQRLRVGPQSAGASPGPACYRRGGPLTITDCNVLLGAVQPDFFPTIFGDRHNEPLDRDIVRTRFTELSRTIATATGQLLKPETLAEGFIQIAVEQMAGAIKKITTQRGIDVRDHTLCCFGGAGGQHACRVADALGIPTIFIHPLAGVLSAYGMGLSDLRVIKTYAVEKPLTELLIPSLHTTIADLTQQGHQALRAQLAADSVALPLQTHVQVHLRYAGSDTALAVDWSQDDDTDNAYNHVTSIKQQFEQAHRRRYGFVAADKPLVVESIAVESVALTGLAEAFDTATAAVEVDVPVRSQPLSPRATVPLYSNGFYHPMPVYARSDLHPHDHLTGPALIRETGATTLIEVGWQAQVTADNHLILTRAVPLPTQVALGTTVDPIRLEWFNYLFMAIAEQMGVVLANTAHSVNIKERLDFSCALFDRDGQLLANAPHIPVHLGSMGDAVQAIVQRYRADLQPGDSYLLNDPYHGGTHLPDVTVITPVFDDDGTLLCYVGSRGHHADIGGMTPGSMPPLSHHIDQEGIRIEGFKLVTQGQFREAELRQLLTQGPYPARNPEQNIADLKAQLAANECGVQALRQRAHHVGREVLWAYMTHVQANAEAQVRKVIATLRDGSFTCEMDDGSLICVAIRVDAAQGTATVDFTGTSPPSPRNFNAPTAVVKAAILYVFRTLIDDDIPLNAGCLKPIKIILPEPCLLNPRYPAAVVAGNVETSQAIVDALYGALGVQAASQGTMNNLTFGNERYQYYETLCGGSGAGMDWHGTAAVHTHMTNSRLTDPEVLETRFPVQLEAFQIRRGSGGKGRFRGGDGVIRRMRFHDTLTLAILANRRRVAPFGLKGGESGQVGRNWVERADGTIETLGSTATVQIQAGDVFVIETPGGGGFGIPLCKRRVEGNFGSDETIRSESALPSDQPPVSR